MCDTDINFMFVSLVISFARRLHIGQKSGTCAAKSFQLLGAAFSF